MTDALTPDTFARLSALEQSQAPLLTLDMKQFGLRLRAARYYKQLTKVALAHKAGLKAPHLLTYLEQGQRTGVHGETVHNLAQVLEVSTDYLFGLTDDPTPHWTRQEVAHG